MIAEESGLLGGGLAIGMLCLVVFGCLRVATMAADRFGAMLAVGVSVLLMTHVFINIGMTIGITPITGLPLPFLSYGGSFMVVCFLMLEYGTECFSLPKHRAMKSFFAEMYFDRLRFGFSNISNHGRRNRRKLASKNNSKHADKNNQGDALPENDLSSAPQEKPLS